LNQSGLPQGMITKYNANNKTGAFNRGGDFVYYLEDGVWKVTTPKP
jgi:hypothetical protein